MKCNVINVTPASFAAAMDKTRALLERKEDREITLSFAGGNYDISTPVILNGATGGKTLRLVGGGRVKPTFSSVKEIPASKFTPVPDKPYYVCQLDKDESGNYPTLRAFYANGSIAHVSRTAEYRTVAPFTVDGKQYRVMQDKWSGEYNDRIYVPVEAVEEAGVENCRGAELHIRVEWEFKVYHIDHIDTEDVYVDGDGNKYVAMQLSKTEKKCGNPILTVCSRVFFICNTTSVLTTPGEYAYEQAYGKLYYYPAGKIEDCTFGLGKTTQLFEFHNFDALTLKGLSFTGLEDAILTRIGYYAAHQAGSWGEMFEDTFPFVGAVKVQNCGECDVCGCTFTDLPCDGLSMLGVLNNVAVRNCRFTNLGASAMRIGRPREYSEVDQINNLRIENNYISNTGFTYENSCAIIVTKIRDGRINHNTILRSSYTAISVGWKWNGATWEYGEQVNLENVEIAYNYIKGFVTNMRDGGAIYTLGGNVKISHSAFMNTMHDNYVIEDEYTCPEDGFFASLYHDGASSNWHTYNNVVIHNPDRVNGSGRIYLQQLCKPFVGSTEGQAAWHILSENNYVTGCVNFGQIYRSQRFDPEKASDMLDITRDLREKDTHVLKSPKDLKKYPEAVRIMEFSGCDPKVGKKK